jgi:hypothetical protein
LAAALISIRLSCKDMPGAPDLAVALVLAEALVLAVAFVLAVGLPLAEAVVVAFLPLVIPHSVLRTSNARSVSKKRKKFYSIDTRE